MGKSTIGCLTIFILGYIIYQNHTFIEKIKEHRFKFLSTFVFAALSGVIYTLSLRGENLNILSWVVDGLFKNIVLISAISSIIRFGSIYLNKNNKTLKYLNKSAFPIYIIHQTILLLIAFFVVPIVKSTTLFGSIYLNKNNKTLKYLNKSAFPIYIIHQTILLLIAFFVVPIVKSTTLAMLIIILLSALFTFAIYEFLKSVRIFNFFLDMK